MTPHGTSTPACKNAFAWIRHHGGRGALAPLTGQDRRALQSFAHLLGVYATADGKGTRYVLVALGATLLAMQESSWPLAKSLIPCMLDWSNEEALWDLIQHARRRCELGA